jgi:hypothetical protein
MQPVQCDETLAAVQINIPMSLCNSTSKLFINCYKLINL